jgi:MoaA/NifB/PqqE/SkfB family radical SAM enzyme
VTPGRAAVRAARLGSAFLRLRRGHPVIASVNLLNRCNQDCPMCEIHRAPDVALPLPSLARALRALRAGGVRIVELSGGEPFLRRDLPEVIGLLDDLGLLFTFTTNGTALTDAGIRALATAGGLLQLAMSLDSLDRGTYRLLRGRDLLPQALAGLDRLREAGLPAPLKLNFVMSRHNAAETPALLAFAAERGLFLSVFPVNHGPGAHRSRSPLMEASRGERADMARRFEELARLRRRGAPLWEPSAFYRAAAAFVRGEPMRACGAAGIFVDLRADGGVAPCVELAPVAGLDDLVAGRAWSALAAARASVDACCASTPCCYTCTVSLAETARHPIAFALESARVLATAHRGRHRRVAAAARAT